MTIIADIQSLTPGAIIELFVLTPPANVAGATISYFHANTNGLLSPITWAGQVYQSWPVEADGFDIDAKGTLPRPKFRIANTGGVISGQVQTYDDLVGWKITRIRTMAKYIDAVNFSPAVNANADTNQKFADDLWYVEQKIGENHFQVEWELSSAFDLQGVQLPGRQVITNSCPWLYRHWTGSAFDYTGTTECGYTGTAYFDANDVATTAANDVCSKKYSSCKLRFGINTLPFGGFPGAIVYGR